MKPLKLLIFDLDGTLIDSRLDITHAVNQTLAHYKIPKLSEEIVSKYVGTGVRPLIAETLKPYGNFSEKEVTDIFTENYLRNSVVHTKVYDGVFEVLKYFERSRKVILTNKSNIFIDPILEKLKLKVHFEKSFGRESFSKMKPDPEPIIQICREFSVQPEDAIIIGDTEVDLLSGARAGVRTCAVTYGFGSIESLKLQNPDFIISHMIELIKLLNVEVS